MRYNDFHKQLRYKFKHAVKESCNKEGCKLDLSSLSSYEITVIDADQYAKRQGHSGKRCDCFVFFSDATMSVSAVEMKSGRADMGEALEQIQAGAKECQNLVRDLSDVKFYPILLARHVDSAEIKILLGRRIRFRGEKYKVIKEKCGAKLKDIVAKWS